MLAKYKWLFGCALLFLSTTSYPDISEALLDIKNHQIQTIRQLDYSKNEYLTFTKPYGKWDSRILGDTAPLSGGNGVGGDKTPPNFLWGFIGGAVFQMEQEELKLVPEKFLSQCFYGKAGHLSHYSQNKERLLELVSAVRANIHSVFVDQSLLNRDLGYVRIDNIFLENGRYWKYNVSPESPYPMSKVITEIEGFGFGSDAFSILEKLTSLRIYNAVKTDDYMVLMTGGLLDNSCGFIVTNQKPSPELFGPLYSIVELEHIEGDFYFYISN